MKKVYVPCKAVITDGYLKDHEGVVVGCDSESEEVEIKLDEITFVTLKVDFIDQSKFIKKN